MSEFELLDRRERNLRAEADVLDKEFAEISRRREAVSGALRRIAEIRADLQEFLAEDSEARGEPEGDRSGSGANDAEPSGDEPVSEAEHGASAGDDPAHGARGPLGIKEAQQRAVSLLATSGRKMRARAIAEAIGEDVSRPARVETTRGRLKTLVTEGALEEEPPGVFFIATSGRPDSGDPEPGDTDRPKEE